MHYRQMVHFEFFIYPIFVKEVGYATRLKTKMNLVNVKDDNSLFGQSSRVGVVKWLVLNKTFHSGLQYSITIEEILDPFVEDLH